MKNYRIIERTYRTGNTRYVIQKRGVIFRWIWFDYRINDDEMVTFENFDDAKEFAEFENSPKYVDKVIYSRKEKLEKLLEK